LFTNYIDFGQVLGDLSMREKGKGREKEIYSVVILSSNKGDI